MGGRGSMGGTRSTYRGDSTSLFRQQMQQGDGGGNGGGGNTSNRDGNNRSSNSGGIQDGGGNGGGGGFGTEDQDIPTTDVNVDVSNMTDEDLKALFEESDEFDELIKLYDELDQPAKFKTAYNRYYTKWIQSQKPEDKIAPGSVGQPIPFIKKPSNGHTLEDITADVETVNRNYKTSNGEYDINCQRCTNAVELRFRGYDVKAQPITEGMMRKLWNPSKKDFDGYGASVDQIARQWVDADGETNQGWDYETKNKLSRASAIKKMEDEIVSWGEGARGFIYVTWMRKSGGSAHIWNVEVRDGKPFYIDGQSNKIGDEVDWKDDFSPSSWRGVMRVDNLYPRSNNSLSWVKERTSEEINAPTQTATAAKMGQIWPVSPENVGVRNSFFLAWRAVYRGQDTTPPAFVDTPEKLDAFNQGLAWARRPA